MGIQALFFKAETLQSENARTRSHQEKKHKTYKWFVPLTLNILSLKKKKTKKNEIK